MRKIRLTGVFCLVSTLFFLVSCQDESPEQHQELQVEIIDQLDFSFGTYDVSDKVKDLISSNYYNTDDIQKIDFLLPDGSTEVRYQVEGDIAFSQHQLETLAALDNVTDRNYHTNNLVSSPRTINVIGYTGGGGYGLTSRARTALQWAINNYNRLNIGISFTLTFGTNYQPYDMVIYRNPTVSGAGGQAGFPSGGNPNKFVQLYAGLDPYNTNVIEHVITHEIGHSVGFRHTDYQTRQSCGQNVNEGSAGVGANPIPGTPAGYDPTSIMLACFGSNEDGEFGQYDIVALEYLY